MEGASGSGAVATDSANAGAGSSSHQPYVRGERPRDRNGLSRTDLATQPDFSKKSVVAAVPGEAQRAKQIASIEFGTMSGADIARASSIEISSRELYKMPQRSPAPFGVLDKHLGVSNKNDTCGTCEKRMQDCAGHFGYIKLELPVFHIGFLKAVLEILQNICKDCSRVLLAPSERADYMKVLSNPLVDALKKARYRKMVSNHCKKNLTCAYCGALNGQVKKVPGAQSFKLLHDRYRKERDADVKISLDAFREPFKTGGGLQDPEITPYISE